MSHIKASARFVANEEYSTFHDQALWFVRGKRDKMMHGVPEWEALREAASNIKEHTLQHLAYYLELFEKNARANGIQVHWAKDGAEHNKIVADILTSINAKKMVKSKSMLTEECHMNPYLEAMGIEVIDTDLGERIIQLQKAMPSHIVMPAIHLKRQTVGKLFEEHLGTEKDNADPLYLTRAARRHLRDHFLSADVAMTGVNFAIAEEGCFVVCTNEGNADMGVSLAPVHIASMGLEKLIPSLSSLSVFTRLLARSATGQPVTTYTSLFKKPMQGGALHVILVDNGRTDTLAEKTYKSILKCIRCAACANTCPVYRRSGGYSYDYFIPGPIGINLGTQKDLNTYKGDLSACSLCYSCNDVCPVKIDLADQIYHRRNALGKTPKASTSKKVITNVLATTFSKPKRFQSALRKAHWVNYIPDFLLSGSWNAWSRYHKVPKFPKESFSELWKKGKIQK